MKYREYPKPIPIEFYNHVHGHHKALAIGVRETPIPQTDRIFVEFLVTLEDGTPAIIWGKDVLPG
jgi:hypothetical protein